MKILTLTAALLITVIANAQTNNDKIPAEPIKQSIFSIGLKGSFGHSYIMPYKDYTFNSSWNAGIAATYAPWAHWGLGLDAIYSSEGASFNYMDDVLTTKLDYVRVPVKAIYFFRTYEKDFRPKVTLGPSVGFLVNQTNTANANFIDLGANVTAGFNYRLLRAVWLNADLSYYQGFLDAYSGNNETDLNGNVRLDLGICVGF